jgi:hypothetical protein
MRLFLPVLLVLLVVLAGCLDGPSDGPADQLPTDGGAQAGGDSSVPTGDLSMGPPDLTPPPDLFPADIAGMINCHGVAICDPAIHFCIIFHSGSQATPGSVSGGPACFEPSDACANQGQQMNCGCIQADNTLGTNCQGSCVDHMDGTYDCYAMP